MALSDYAHWNEEAPIIWWQEEGRHGLGEIDGWGDDDDGRGFDDCPECADRADCIRNGCFSLPSSTRIWECDICGRQFPGYLSPSDFAGVA
jgi:hypothetical protein